MTLMDLAKATVGCGSAAFVIYTCPEVGQVLLIGVLTLMWILYARQTLRSLRRR